MTGVERPLYGFSPETFEGRRGRILEALGKGAMVLPSAPILYRSRDTEHRYRPDSELFYTTGLTEPGAVVLLRAFAQEERFVLFAPPRDPKSEIWSGPRRDPEETGELLGADVAYPTSELGERLPSLLAGSNRVFFRIGSEPRCQALVFQALETARNRVARKGEGPLGVTDPGVVLDEMRVRKDAEEIERIRRATQLTVEGFRATLPRVRPGMGEWEVESLLESSFRGAGARGAAFPTIVGSGESSCVLHYAENHRRIEADGVVLVDGGADVDLYAGDVTRTFTPGRPFTDSERAVYEVVADAEAAGIAAVRPGNRVDEIHRAVLHTLVSGLVLLDVLKGSVNELVEEKRYEPFYPHQSSHWLGLDVHDVGAYAFDGESRRLEPGMVLTVEPGLYFGRGEGVPETPFTGIGVRIEDDILVTEGGHENLTASLPVDAGEMESLLGVGG